MKNINELISENILQRDIKKNLAGVLKENPETYLKIKMQKLNTQKNGCDALGKKIEIGNLILVTDPKHAQGFLIALVTGISDKRVNYKYIVNDTVVDTMAHPYQVKVIKI